MHWFYSEMTSRKLFVENASDKQISSCEKLPTYIFFMYYIIADTTTTLILMWKVEKQFILFTFIVQSFEVPNSNTTIKYYKTNIF